jgi:signal transduction histidine kinase/ActR/RegA family two-component response regulator
VRARCRVPLANPVPVFRLRLASIACSAVGAFAGLTALVGWITANELLKGAFVAGITMKTNMALCLILSGAFIGSLAIGADEGRGRARWMNWLAWLVVCIAIGTLVEHLFGVNLGIDELLFEEDAGAAATESPNRMGPVGATCLTLLGLSRLSIGARTRSGRAPSQYLTIAVMLVASVPLLGFLFDVRALFGIGKYTGIALPTALALWLLALGLLFARLDAGLMRRLVEEDSGAVMIRRLLPAAVFVPILLMLLRIAGQEVGLFDQALGRALLVLAFMVVFTVLIWRTGEVVFRQATNAALAEGKLRERLVQSLEQLSSGDQLKTDFLAVLAHELRNPLAPVRNAVHLLRARGTDPESERTYDVIERQVEHLTRLIEDLMDVSRISRDQLELRKSRVVVSDIVSRAIEGTRYLVDGHRHQLTVSIPAEDVEFDADAARLVQVLINLLANAARYTPEGGQISVVAKHEAEALELSVSDNGVGIPVEQLPHVFDMFYQGGREHRSGHHGLGIGLGLVKKLVELHGGSVSARSGGAGQGSTFTVRIPGPIHVVKAQAPAPTPVTTIPSLSGLSVLVVEDNEDSAETLTELLELTGARLHTAHDGEKALLLGAQLEPNIILLDIGLPGMSGYEVAERARRTPWGTRAFIVALTGWGNSDDRARSKAAGFDRHLVKPVDPRELMALIAEGRDRPVHVESPLDAAR